MKGLFVATSLNVWSTDEPERFVRDFQINDTVYRRLDPEYYAWLRSRMTLARKAAAAGRIDSAAFEELRGKFNAIHEWALQHLGEPVLLEAVRKFAPHDYCPPTPESDVPLRRSPERVGAGAAMVDAICEKAVAFGWKRARLYGTSSRRGFDVERGLAGCLRPGDRIGQVTRESIEVIGRPPAEVRQRFYNPDVDQPWLRRVALSGAEEKTQSAGLQFSG